ncbi:Ig-like domain-containing protein [Desulfonatronum parangueonense]
MLTRFLILIFLLLGTANPCLGHKLLLIAWVQGDRLMAEAAFGTGQYASKMQIIVDDAVSGETLLTGATDEQGFFEITLPPEVLNRRAPLLVTASDGAGHVARQTIPAEDLLPAVSADRTEISALTEDAEQTQPRISDLDETLLRELVQDAVRQEVAPLRRDILALQQAGPGIPEIIGGIGWIIGLASLGAWLLRR